MSDEKRPKFDSLDDLADLPEIPGEEEDVGDSTRVSSVDMDLIRRTQRERVEESEDDDHSIDAENRDCYLEIMTGLHKGKRVLLDSKVVIGREGQDINLDHPSVSSVHCTLRNQGGIISIIDNGSTNGTYIDGQKIRPGEMIILEENDHILVGQIELHVFTVEIGENPDDYVNEDDDELEVVPEASATTKIKTPQRQATRNEVKPSKKVKSKKKSKSLFSTIFSIFKSKSSGKSLELFKRPDFMKANVSPKKLKKKSSNQVVGELALAQHRIPVVLAEFGLSYILANFLSKDEVFEQFLFDAKVSLESLIPDLDFLLLQPTKTYFSAAIIYILYRLITNLIFGVTLMQLIMGILPTGNLVVSRIGGFFREALGFILGIFIGPDLVLLRNKKTLKEQLTGTELIISNKLQLIAASILFFPLIVFTLLYSDALNYQHFTGGITIGSLQKIQMLKDKDGNIIEEVETKFRSDYLDALVTVYRNDRWRINTTAKVEKRGRVTRFTPVLSIYNDELKVETKWHVHGKNNLFDHLLKAANADDVMRNRYSKLYSAVTANRSSFSPIVSASTTDVEQIFEKGIVEELKKYLIDSMYFTFDDAFDLMMKVQKGYKGHFVFREALDEAYQTESSQSIDFVELGNVDFLSIRPKVDQGTQRMLLIPLSSLNGLIYEISYPKTKDEKLLLDEFLGFVLNGNTYLFDVKQSEQSVPVVSLEADNLRDIYDYGSILDNFFELDLGKDRRYLLIKYYGMTQQDYVSRLRSEDSANPMWKIAEEGMRIHLQFLDILDKRNDMLKGETQRANIERLYNRAKKVVESQ